MKEQQSSSSLSGYSVRLVPVDKSNQNLLFEWRNEVAIRQQMVNQEKITKEQHQQWFKSLNNNIAEQHFVIYYKDSAIGAINIRAVNSQDLSHCQHGEVGLYIANEKYKGNMIAFAPSLVINDFAFKQLKLNQLTSKVKADNLSALKYNQQLGYHLAPEEKDFVEINLTADNYNKSTKSLKNFLSRGSNIVKRTT